MVAYYPQAYDTDPCQDELLGTEFRLDRNREESRFLPCRWDLESRKRPGHQDNNLEHSQYPPFAPWAMWLLDKN